MRGRKRAHDPPCTRRLQLLRHPRRSEAALHGRGVVAVGADAGLADAAQVAAVRLGEVGDAGRDARVVVAVVVRGEGRRVGAGRVHGGHGRAGNGGAGDARHGAGLRGLGCDGGRGGEAAARLGRRAYGHEACVVELDGLGGVCDFLLAWELGVSRGD